MKIQYTVHCTSGRIRLENEDNFYLNGEIRDLEDREVKKEGSCEGDHALFAVCDGLGGEGNGEKASFAAVTMLEPFRDDFCRRSMEYFDAANQEMHSLQRNSQSGMDCTFTGLYLSDSGYYGCNLGDSRLYLLRDQQFTQLSEDHSEFAAMLRYGVFKPEDYYTSNARNRLTRSVGCLRETLVPREVSGETLLAGDIFLLCSDGLCGYVHDDEMSDILNKDMELTDMADELVGRALIYRSDDNITVMIIRIQEAGQ